MTTPPPAPESSTGKDLTGAFVWTLGATFVAVYAFMKAPGAGDSQWFYYVAGAVAVIVAILNGFTAWTAFNRKSPPVA